MPSGERAVNILKQKRPSAAAAAAALIFLLSACGEGLSEGQPAKGKALTADVETVESVQLPVYAVYPGTVISADRVEIASRLTGYVYDLRVHEGQEVAKGELLLSVDPTGVKTQIQQAKAGLAKAKASLADAEANYKRYKQLYRDHAATKQQLDEMERAWKVARGNDQAAEAALEQAQSQLKYAEVRAPFDGLVVSKYVENGQLASPGTPLLTIENPRDLQVEVQVAEQAFTHLKLGQEVRIRFEGPDGKMRAVGGAVARLVSAADPVTHTHLVKIDLPPESGAYSGEYALVNVPVGEQEGVVVPERAIHNRAGITGVFVMGAEGRAQFRMTTLGPSGPGGRVILSGLFPGDRVILSAEGNLVNGAEIEPRSGGGK